MSARKSSKQIRIESLQEENKYLYSRIAELEKEKETLRTQLENTNEVNKFYQEENKKIDLQLATVRIEYANMHQQRVNEADYNSRQLNVMGNISIAMLKVLDRFGGDQ